ncbi:hypothetical protein ABEB36_012551 [Hypothenemus hampei]|uniref:Carbonic anhydrase n=1 Tax=Hypothenemus hampei TaxID=57062 RepID=A0ABD1EBL9_HYPHA
MCIILSLLLDKIYLIFITLLLNFHSSAAQSWSHTNQNSWSGSCQTGQSQSPIELTDTAVISIRLPDLILENIEYFDTVDVSNNGHGVTLNFDRSTSAQPRLYFKGLSFADFTLASAHFHWPSEHSINGELHNLELHFVFYSTKYATLTEALEVPNHVTVLAVLYDCDDDDDPESHVNFEIINNAVKNVESLAGSTVQAAGGITLKNLLPDDYQSFYAYNGSLTTPGCNEGVNWIVLKDSVDINEHDLENLIDNILTSTGEELTFNNRNLQPLNGRIIYST